MILSTTCGHPGWWNDKRLVLFDDFVCGLKYRTVLSDVEFQLFERDLSGKTILVKYRGSWLIVDNGYLDWSVTVPPMKDPKDISRVEVVKMGRIHAKRCGVPLWNFKRALPYPWEFDYMVSKPWIKFG
jgi:hypothetical protein